jgi:hypothetical protein
MVDWVREDLVGLAANLESVLIGIETYDSFECRGQNRIVGAKLSEHGRANALDIRAIRLKSGRGVHTDPAVSKDIRIAARTSVCERFTTVLGPVRTATMRTTSISISQSAEAVIDMPMGHLRAFALGRSRPRIDSEEQRSIAAAKAC